MRAVRDEETTWKARPDWARDGRRVVYASYLGRQWHQLWLMPAEGGDAFQLTYGEFDATAPRWSPDGTPHRLRVERGRRRLRCGRSRVPGGERRKVESASGGASAPPAGCRVDVTERGRYVPARISVTGADGRSFAPEGAWRHADDCFDRAERRIEHGYFHSDGGAAGSTLPAGPVHARGDARARVRAGAAHARRRRRADARAERLALERIADWPARGWWSGDLHVHMNYGGAYRATPRTLRARPRPRTCTWSTT